MSIRRQAILMRENNPLIKGTEIATQLGVSKQRIQYILKREGLPNKAHYKPKVIYCRICGGISKGRGGTHPLNVCSDICNFKAQFSVVTCVYCNLSFFRNNARIKDGYRIGKKNIYCSRSCLYKGRKHV